MTTSNVFNTTTDDEAIDALLETVVRVHKQGMTQPGKLEAENQKTRKIRSTLARWEFILGAGGD